MKSKYIYTALSICIIVSLTINILLFIQIGTLQNDTSKNQTLVYELKLQTQSLHNELTELESNAATSIQEKDNEIEALKQDLLYWEKSLEYEKRSYKDLENSLAKYTAELESLKTKLSPEQFAQEENQKQQEETPSQPENQGQEEIPEKDNGEEITWEDLFGTEKVEEDRKTSDRASENAPNITWTDEEYNEFINSNQ